MSATNFAARRLLNSFLGGTSTPSSPSYGALTGPGVPSHLGAALDTATPTEAGANFNEPPTSDGYARIALTLPGDFTVATDDDPSLIENVAALTFPAAINNNWGVITHVGLFDSAIGGTSNLLYILPLTVNRTINVGETLSFAAGELELTAD